MKNNKGFTLTEVLLAVTIVGVIGVALAALTTAASRESHIGSSRSMLRGYMTSALRQMREDIRNTSRVLYVRGNVAISDSTPTRLLVLALNKDAEGKDILKESDLLQRSQSGYVSYCFVKGSISSVPDGATAGGKIIRRISSVKPTSSDACTTGKAETILENVKYIGSGSFWSPSVYALDTSNGKVNEDSSSSFAHESGVLRFRFIVELPGNSPIVNEAVEEIFILPGGVHRENVAS